MAGGIFEDGEQLGRGPESSTYVWAKDVVGYGRLVDGGVFVRLQVDQRIVRDALGGSFFCKIERIRSASLHSKYVDWDGHVVAAGCPGAFRKERTLAGL